MLISLSPTEHIPILLFQVQSQQGYARNKGLTNHAGPYVSSYTFLYFTCRHELPRTAHPPASFWASLELVSLYSGQRFRLLVTETPRIMPFDSTPPSRHVQRPSLVCSMTFLPTPHFCQPLTPYFKEKHSPTLCVSFHNCRSHCLSPAWFSAELLDTHRVAGGLQSQNKLQPGASLITVRAAVLR